MTYQLTVVCCRLKGVGVGEEQQLGVGVDGDVGLDDGLVPADEVGNILDLDFRLRFVPTEGLAAGVAGGSSGCNENYIVENHQPHFLTSANALRLCLKVHFKYCSHEVFIYCHDAPCEKSYIMSSVEKITLRMSR